jgi:hypothetical protein
MEEHQPRIKRTVLFDNESSSLSCRNLGSSGPKLRLVIHPFLGLRTDSEHVRAARPEPGDLCGFFFPKPHPQHDVLFENLNLNQCLNPDMLKNPTVSVLCVCTFFRDDTLLICINGEP